MYKLRFLLFTLLFMISSCSTVDAIFGPEEPELATAASKEVSSETVVTDNNQLETEIAALRGSLQQLKTDLDRKKAMKARELAQSNPRQPAQSTRWPSAQPTTQAPATQNRQPSARTDRLWVTVSFRSGYMELTSDSSKALKRLAAKFLSKQRQQTIEVRGYTDDEPIGGYARSRHTPRHPYKTNLALSNARAHNVADALIAAGISANVVQARGFGATDFAADNRSEAGRQKNRRAEIHLVSR